MKDRGPEISDVLGKSTSKGSSITGFRGRGIGVTFLTGGGKSTLLAERTSFSWFLVRL